MSLAISNGALQTKYLRIHPSQGETEPITPPTEEEIQEMKERESRVNIEGTLFSAGHVEVGKKSLEELLDEIIKTDINPKQGNTLVAFQSPYNKDNIITFELDNETLQGLKREFGDEDFLLRADGIARLRGRAQEYVASWHNEISMQRGYSRADMNGNGIIDEGEEGSLRIGFERKYDYDHIDEKVVNANLHANGKTYQKYSDTSDFHNIKNGLPGQSLLFIQHIEFGRTIGEELKNTLQNDRDFDRNITLKEGLAGKYGGDEEKLREEILLEANRNHQHYLDTTLIPPPKNELLHRDLGGLSIHTEDELLEGIRDTKIPENANLLQGSVLLSHYVVLALNMDLAYTSVEKAAIEYSEMAYREKESDWQNQGTLTDQIDIDV